MTPESASPPPPAELEPERDTRIMLRPIATPFPLSFIARSACPSSSSAPPASRGKQLIPTVVFGTLFAWPALERRFTQGERRHDLLDRPRDHPTRTAIGAAFASWVVVIFFVGAADRLFYRLHISYQDQIHFWRGGVWAVPIIVFFITRAVARSLQRSEVHPMRGWQGEIVRRDRLGAVTHLAVGDDGPDPPPTQAPVGSTPVED